ncbi:MAG: acyl-CoA dehydrogenase family protein [Rhodospirillales bacterium]|jgi:acyl-CoA dehydrogenase
MSNEIRTILVDQASRLFTDLATKDVIDQAEQGTWPQALWNAVEENGLTLAAVGEEQNGAGAAFGDAMALVRQAGRFAVPAPFAETVIAAWLLSRCGVTPPSGPISFATNTANSSLAFSKQTSGWSASGTLAAVPWGRHVKTILAVHTDAQDNAQLILLDPSESTIKEGMNIAGEARDDLTFNQVAVHDDAVFALPDHSLTSLEYLGALSRVVMMAGALDQVLDLSVQHALDRVQFGRPIAKFQAIQQSLAVLAGEAAAAGAASDAAVEALETSSGEFQIAAAKVRAGEAASEGANIAHQVHGAMGFTYEHPLHQLTRRLWAWRDEFGTDGDWAVTLGALALQDGGDGLWPLITAS